MCLEYLEFYCSGSYELYFLNGAETITQMRQKQNRAASSIFIDDYRPLVLSPKSTI